MHVTSPGRNGGSKEDKDEQSSLVGCGWKTHDFLRSLDRHAYQRKAIRGCCSHDSNYQSKRSLENSN